MRIIFEDDENAIEIAVDFLQKKKIIAFATDTVYGLAVDAASFEAVALLYNLKKRNKNKPIAIFLPNLKAAEDIFIFDELSKKIAAKFLPGALTLVLKKRPQSAVQLAKNLNEKDEFLGFRIVENNFIAKLLEKFGRAIAVTSANISGEKGAISADEIITSFDGQGLNLLIDGGLCYKKNYSTVIKVDNNSLSVLREGAIKINELKLI